MTEEWQTPRQIEEMVVEEPKDTLHVHVELLDQTRRRIEAALDEKRDAEAWNLFDRAWPTGRVVCGPTVHPGGRSTRKG